MKVLLSLLVSLLVLSDSSVWGNNQPEQIDRLVEAQLSRQREKPLSPSSDEEFLRRIYLDITGRIPSYPEAESFLSQDTPNKRSILIDTLLESDGYVSHTFNWWADLLRIRSNGSPAINASGNAYANWVKESIATNKPYDEFVRDLVNPVKDKSAVFAWDNGAAGYYMRDSGMPLDNMSNTIQVFLGTRLVCAQCHDHPFDKWSQMDYHQMAAYTFNTIDTRTRPQEIIPSGFQKNKDKPFFRQAANDVFRPIQYGVSLTERKHKLPHDYRSKRRPAEGGEEVRPSTRGFEDAPKANGGKGQKLLENYSEWLTSRENRRFNRVIANRMWKRAFGRGLVEPVDDWKDDTEAENRYLLDYLERLIVQLDYDLKAFMRILYNTRTYQRTFAVPRRMTAEQIYDSVGILSAPMHDNPPGPTSNNYSQAASIIAVDETKLTEVVKAVASVLEEHGESVKNAREKSGPELRKAIQAINKKRDDAINKIKNDAFGDPPKPNREKPEGFIRASGLRSPAPNGHFLRSFGQSDRETIQGAEAEASTDQALLLLNGTILQNARVPLDTIKGIEDQNQIHDILFLSTLTRYPTESERIAMQNESPEDIVAALLLTTEFLFVR